MAALLTAEDVAAQLQMTKAWVWSETRAGRFPAVRCGRSYRYRQQDVDAWIEANLTGALRREAHR